MRIFTLAALGALALGVAFAGSVSAAAQSDEPSSESSDGVITEAAPVPTTGTLVITFDITLKNAYPAGSAVSCLAFVLALSENTSPPSSADWIESVIGTAKVSGSTATCTATIPYSWNLGTGTGVKNFFTGEYDVLVLDASGKMLLGDRTSSSLFASKVAIPASGTTTKYTVNVTI